MSHAQLLSAGLWEPRVTLGVLRLPLHAPSPSACLRSPSPFSSKDATITLNPGRSHLDPHRNHIRKDPVYKRGEFAGPGGEDMDGYIWGRGTLCNPPQM